MRFLGFLLPICLAFLSGQASSKTTCDTTYGTVCIEVQVQDNTVTFFAENRHRLLPVTLDIEVETQNLQRRSGRSGPFVLEGNSREKLFALSTIRNAAWRYDYTYSWSRGDVTARHDESYRYRLPFEAGRAIRIGQSCNGRFSHLGRKRYAVDFGMEIGTPILAARGGRVVAIKEDSNRGGPARSYENDGNYVIVEHGDRTLAQYFHLQRIGAEVRLGQTIRRGDLIGYSGNTGMSTGPHLHFDVIKGAVGTESETLPVRFDTVTGPITCPARGTELRASQ